MSAPQLRDRVMVGPAETFLHGEITWRSDVSSGHWRIRVNPAAPFTFQAGQYATLGVRTPQRIVERPYSIASSPYDPQLEFFIELVPDGALTPLLHRLQVGDTLSLRKKAKGRFLFDRTSGRTNHLLLCTSTGIAPYVSYVRTLLKDWEGGRFTGDHRLFLIQGASRSSEFGYQSEFERIASEVLGSRMCQQSAGHRKTRPGPVKPDASMTSWKDTLTSGRSTSPRQRPTSAVIRA
jgi:ferredoxin/flavodoxin---NADP+ reductase